MKVVLVNQELTRFKWSWAWLRYDANNSYEEPTEFYHQDDLQAALDELPYFREVAVCEFYACPLCDGVTTSPLTHLLDAHTEAVRIWQTGEHTWHIKLAGETKWMNPHRVHEEFPQYASREMLEIVKAACAMYDGSDGGIASVKRAVRAYLSS